MKLIGVFLMCVLAVNAGLTDVKDNISSVNGNIQAFITTVTTSDFGTAVSQALKLFKDSNGAVIKEAITKLIRNSKRIVLEFAYKLWIGGGRTIVTDFFPIQFTQLLSESNVTIVNVRDNLAIKLGAATDDMGDRNAYGDAKDKTSENVRWKFLPMWENNTLYFKIQSIRRDQYLKLGTAADSSGDHIAYGSDDSETNRHQWYLKPTQYEEKVLFFIYNRQYEQALKLGRAVDSDGDRQVYSESGYVDDSPELYGWSINPVNCDR